jgi:hypothetical protein
MYTRILLATVLALSFTACGGHDHDGYDTFQVCFDEHTGDEGLSATMSITICTLDHPIDGETLEFATAAECVTYVTANLGQGEATAAEIMAGCEEYIVQKGM